MAYDPAVATLVHAWKERGHRRVATLAAELTTEALAQPSADTLAFVPGDGERGLLRGDRPAERLARELGRRWGLEVTTLLARSGSGRRQRGLPLHERRRNVRGAFRALGRAPSSVVLVDDVYTSGATAGAAASALRRAGARRVDVVTFARAVR